MDPQSRTGTPAGCHHQPNLPSLFINSNKCSSSSNNNFTTLYRNNNSSNLTRRPRTLFISVLLIIPMFLRKDPRVLARKREIPLATIVNHRLPIRSMHTRSPPLSSLPGEILVTCTFAFLFRACFVLCCLFCIRIFLFCFHIRKPYCLCQY